MGKPAKVHTFFWQSSKVGSDPRIRRIRAKHGSTGYGIFLAVLEALYKCGGSLVWSEAHTILFAAENNISNELLIQILGDLYDEKLIRLTSIEPNALRVKLVEDQTLHRPGAEEIVSRKTSHIPPKGSTTQFSTGDLIGSYVEICMATLMRMAPEAASDDLLIALMLLIKLTLLQYGRSSMDPKEFMEQVIHAYIREFQPISSQ